MDTSEPTEPLKEESTSNDKGKAKQLPGDTQPRDAFIVVMGSIGSGKSTFVNLCSGTDSVVVGNDLMQETQSVTEVNFEYNGVNIHLIDTPGFEDNLGSFDDTTRSDTEVLMMIASYFSKLYNSNVKMDGIVYMFPITRSKFGSSEVKNLHMFLKLVGDEASSEVVLVTSMWDMVRDWNTAEDREEGLRERFWKPLMDKGSEVRRLDHRRRAALQVLDALLRRGETHGKVLQIQRELVDEKKTLEETEAGLQLSNEIRKLQEGFRRKLDDMKSELNYAIAAKDADMEQYLRREQAQFERKLSQVEDVRAELRVDFERLMRQKEEMNVSLIRQLEMERREKAVLTAKLISGLDALRAQVQQNESRRFTKLPVLGRRQVRTDQSSIQHLEGELEKAQKDVAEKEARIRDIRGFTLDVLRDTINSPPPAYTQSKNPIVSIGVAGSQTYPRKAPTNINNELTTSNKFRSYFARNQNRRSQQGPENAHGSNERAASFHQTRPNLRVVDEERRNLRAQLYQNSLLSFQQGTDSEKASNPVLQRGSTGMKEVDALCKEYLFPVGNQHEMQYLLSHTLTTMSMDALPPSAWLFYQSYLLRNAILAVYHNCRGLQAAKLAGPWFSMLVLESLSKNRTKIINLNRVNIEDIRKVVERLSSFIITLQDSFFEGHVSRSSVSTLTRLSNEVQLLYQNIFKRLGLKEFLIHHLERSDLATKLESMLNRESILNSGSSGELAYFVDIFAQWWCATRALDVGVVAYERGHVSSFEPTFSINLGFELPELSALRLRDNSQGSELSRSLHYTRRGLKCLASFFQEHDVWVLSMEVASNDLYVAADIETFADVWGPVWKVVDQWRPELIAKYNVRGGSIIPWPSVPDIHPELRPNERLCHWKSNANYIHHYGEDSANNDSSTSSSDSSETEEDSVQATSFSGDEVLVIGAGQDARLQLYDCHCSLNAIRQGLENAGRLDRIIASKSYRYIDSQQRSLVGGSHGFQTGLGWTVKDKSQESLKVRLLDRWENEPDLRDPREFENIWGVAVSLCTMNAQRVRLVELFGEESVMTLLRHFPWSDLSADGSRSYQRHRFLEAIRSPDPFALGNLWEYHPHWRTSIGNAIMICLRILFKTGYNENRNEFHMLWLPPGCRDPRRVTLKSSDQGWTDFLRDTTYSITVAVIIEDSLGVGPCSGNRSRWFKHPSILETAICVNTDLSPAAQLIKTRGPRDEHYYMTRGDSGKWRRIWDVSDIRRGDRFWMRSQNRVITLQPLNSWHLLLEMDTVKREKFQALIGLKPTEHWKGHWEYTDEELDGDGVRPIPVQITS